MDTAEVAVTTFILHHNMEIFSDQFVTFIEIDSKLLKAYTVSPWSHEV